MHCAFVGRLAVCPAVVFNAAHALFVIFSFCWFGLFRQSID
jgi:hypothetical protein